ncbi:hypothetical protein [Cupriavidus gilardii]|uniref:Transmembrane protein n=1 Tax=Cupriavidus gilardii TaxID=82541 RepID=A0A849B9Q6_9BURK|nr:hypothetical protein [Cupriavidus gilardii]KAB0597841.1 hypothetical protein F7Q96_07975 [Cupriavidus gilardii]MCT9015438.1 hypothetical protein [Cupriavidus gilardii]MCT9055208.1 hypothetical protein [Cupriavidus gilardii]NNH10623.1 hypothetical protein [Cupriavidus gilardii]WNG71790.1 hypothetical protein QWJ31_16945 [Cupriavidus gilardii]
MSHGDDFKGNGPPSLFGSGNADSQGPDTRILASLEGRVASHAPVKKKTPDIKRHGVFATLALLLVGAGAVAFWLGKGNDVEAPTVATVVPAESANSAASAAPAADMQAAAAGAAASVEAPASSATIVDVSPERDADDDALDNLGKMPSGDLAAAGLGAAALAGGTALAANAAPDHDKSAADRHAKSTTVAAKEPNKKTLNQEVNKTKITASNQTATKRQHSNTATKVASRSNSNPTTVGKTKTERSRIASNNTRRVSKKTGANTGNDRDAELLAALLAPTPEEKTTTASRTRKSGTAQRSQ